MPSDALKKLSIENAPKSPEAQGAINRIAQARQLRNQGMSAVDASMAVRQGGRQSTGFTVPMPDTVPAEALNGNVGRADVRSMRDTMEQNNLATEQFNTDYSNLMGRVQAPLNATPFQDPQAFIEQTLLRRSTDTQNNLDQARQDQANTLRGMSGDLTETRNDAVTQFGLPELQANLADTRNRIAERTNQLRTTLRDFETNAERRGVAREFVESEKQKVQADAAAELADLAIIESAQSGNVAMAQDDIDRAVNAKIQAFEFENAAIEAEITRLDKMDTRESQARSEQLQIALGERTRLITQAIDDERQKLTYLFQAAANGADKGTLDAIRKATTLEEAAMMVTPFLAPKPVATSTKRDTQVVDGKLIDMQTGEVISELTGAGVAAASEAQKGLDQVRFLRGTVTDAKDLVSATGPNAISRGLGNFFVGNTRVKQLQNKIDTLKTNLLTLNSDPNLKKFFGPQMTEKDTELLMSAGSTLDAYSNSVKDNEDELIRYDNLLKKIENSLAGATATFGPEQEVVTAPDGMEYVFTD